MGEREITPDLVRSVIKEMNIDNCLIFAPQSFVANLFRNFRKWDLGSDKYRTIFRSPPLKVINIPRKDYQDTILFLDKEIVKSVFKESSTPPKGFLHFKIGVYEGNNILLDFYAHNLIQWNVNNELLEENVIWIKCEQKGGTFFAKGD
ncbi:MAG: hypothetical protein ACE5OZ_01205 [Candidatus Heimdallarchaeota archaeon]